MGWLRAGVTAALLVLLAAGTARPETRLVSADDRQVVFEVTVRDFRLEPVAAGGLGYVRAVFPGGIASTAAGAPDVPVLGQLVGIPFGVAVSVQLLDADYRDYRDVRLVPVPQEQMLGDGQWLRLTYAADPEAYGRDAFDPPAAVAVSGTGVMRDQRVAGISIRPVQYNPVQRRLRVATRLRIAVSFMPERGLPQAVPSREPNIPPELERFYGGVLVNGATAAKWRGRVRERTGAGLRKATAQWREPATNYYKLRIVQDAVYRLDAGWFSDAGIALQAGDTERVRLWLNGEEVPLYVDDGGDGALDEGDGIYFYGRYRRAADRDFESDYGPENVYWLAVTADTGLRYEAVDAAPVGGYAEVPWFTWTQHAEADSIYNPLGYAADADRDHFFWKLAGSAFEGGPVTPATVSVHLPGLKRDAVATATVRVGMHGLTSLPGVDPDHRTVVQLGETALADDRWDGQTAFAPGGTAAVSLLGDTTRVTLVVPGASDFPADYVDQVLLNWVEVTYPRSLVAVDGGLTVPMKADAPAGTYSVGGFRTSGVLILDAATDEILTDAEVVPEGVGYRVRFQVSAGARTLVLTDDQAVLPAPAGEADSEVDLGSETAGASYVIVTHPSFRTAADRLAAHRQADGQTVLVAEVADIYDAFSFGQVDPNAIRAFVAQGFDTWSVRPLYLMLLGRASFDYRDFFKQAQYGRRCYVPALPYQSANRGLAFSDQPFGTVVGDDGFVDVFVGRASVNNAGEAATVVEKIVRYDAAPEARWRDRVLYLASYEDPPIFAEPSDALAATYAEPFGLETFKVYNQAGVPPQPNEDTHEVIRQINEGRLIVNFMGHGSVATMQSYLNGTYQQGNYSYMSQIVNADRLPLFLAMSCLNGQYADPQILCLAEEMTKKRDGGAIGYISSAALQFYATNLAVNSEMFRSMFQDSVLAFGASLAAAKARVASGSPVLSSTLKGLNLLGDPAQLLAAPGGPDFLLEPDALDVAAEGEIVAEDTARVHLALLNTGITPVRGPVVVVADRNLDTGTLDTLFTGRLPAFGQADSVTVLWPLAGRAGAHILSAAVDPSDEIPELDETNNTAELGVDVFGALSAVATAPAASQVVAASAVQLAVRSGAPAQRTPVAAFEVGSSPALDGPDVAQSGPLSGENGLFVWRPIGLTAGTYYWRARLSEGDERGPWTQPLPLIVAASAPERQLLWRQSGAEALRLGTGQDVTLYSDGTVGRVLEPPPIRVDAQTREAAVLAEGIQGSAVVCTDGTYLYVSRFYTAPAIYPGSDVFARIGTGLGGTVAGRNYGTLSDAPVNGISATCHPDGFLYADDGAQDELVRISVSTGQADRVRVPDGLLEFQTGLTVGGHSLITSDGSLIYNVASGVAGARRTGWSVRAFDPADGWRLVREYTVAPTATGFTYLHTDGILADGRYLYLIEFGTGLTHRIRAVDALDGTFVAEYTSDQAETDILGGQYDWVNNKVWLGQLNAGTVYRYEGRRLPDSGSLTSDDVGPATGFDTLTLSVLDPQASQGQVLLDILGEGTGGSFTPVPGWDGLAPGPTVDLSSLPAEVSRIRLRLYLFGGPLGASPELASWQVAYRPVSNVAITDLKAAPTTVAELEPVQLSVDVQNRGPLDLVLGTVVAFYSGLPESGRLIGRQAIPEATALGQLTPVTFEWHTARFAGTNLLTARAEDLLGRPSLYARVVEGAEPVVVTPSGDQTGPEVTITAQDAAGQVREEDYLPSALRLSVVLTDPSGIDRSSVSVRLVSSAGELVEDVYGDRIRDLAEDDGSLSFVYATELEDDDYRFEVTGRDGLGNGPASRSLAFKVSSDLRLERVLNVPNPMSDETAFTYILSRPSDVVLRVYTVSGRLVRVFDNAPGRAGYNQVAWDGRDGDGHPLANGVYLYTVTADDGNSKARVKERLIIYR